MKKLIWLTLLCIAVPFLPGCSKDDDDVDLDNYVDWKAQNEEWLADLKAKKNADGSPYYETVIPKWNPAAYVLMHFFNDRAETAGNLVPLYTSTVDVRYIGYNCENEPFDSSSVETAYGRLGIRRFIPTQLIQGWAIALLNMHVGDTAEIIVPYEYAYGTSAANGMKPYSNLRFNVRLDDIYRYEANPY